jgi:hypothetical protein
MQHMQYELSFWIKQHSLSQSSLVIASIITLTWHNNRSYYLSVSFQQVYWQYTVNNNACIYYREGNISYPIIPMKLCFHQMQTKIRTFELHFYLPLSFIIVAFSLMMHILYLKYCFYCFNCKTQ